MYSADELVVVDRGRLVVVMLHVVFGDLEGGVVGQLAGRIVVPDMLERLESVPGGVDDRQAAVESAVPGKQLVFRGVGIVLQVPELGDGELAADELLEVIGGGIDVVKQLEAVVSVDVFSSLKLRLGQVVLGGLAPGRAFAVLGDLGECFLGFREVALLEQLLGGFELGIGLGILGRLGDRAASRRSPG